MSAAFMNERALVGYHIVYEDPGSGKIGASEHKAYVHEFLIPYADLDEGEKKILGESHARVDVGCCKNDRCLFDFEEVRFGKNGPLEELLSKYKSKYGGKHGKGYRNYIPRKDFVKNNKFITKYNEEQDIDGKHPLECFYTILVVRHRQCNEGKLSWFCSCVEECDKKSNGKEKRKLNENKRKRPPRLASKKSKKAKTNGGNSSESEIDNDDDGDYEDGDHGTRCQSDESGSDSQDESALADDPSSCDEEEEEESDEGAGSSSESDGEDDEEEGDYEDEEPIFCNPGWSSDESDGDDE